MRLRGRILAGVCAAMLAGAAASPAHATGLTEGSGWRQDEGQQCQPGKTTLVAKAPTALTQLGAARAWQISSGDVTVAVVDSGVAASNVHFPGAVLQGADLVAGGGTGQTDVYGHGTVVAGQIAAREVNGSGLVGLAPKAMILPVRTYESEQGDPAKKPNSGRTATGIRWAADNGAKVIVVPQSLTANAPELKAAVAHATRAGALVVASAGNAEQGVSATAPRYPAAYPEVLSVTAVDANGAPSDSVARGAHIDIAAPGMQVLSTYLGHGDCYFAENPSTSYATGYAGAVAALVAAAYPKERPADWKYRILATGLRPSRSEPDPAVGWGLVAPYDALNFINDGTLDGPPNPRFPKPSPPSTPRMDPPRPEENLHPARLRALGVVAGVGGLAVLAILLGSRLPSRNR